MMFCAPVIIFQHLSLDNVFVTVAMKMKSCFILVSNGPPKEQMKEGSFDNYFDPTQVSTCCDKCASDFRNVFYRKGPKSVPR